jgi:hypothetical protein
MWLYYKKAPPIFMKKTRRLIALLFLLHASFCSESIGQSVTIYRGGIALSPSYGSIKVAIANTVSNDSLVLSADTFYEHDINIRRVGGYHIKLSGVAHKTLIDAQKLGRIIHWQGSDIGSIRLKDLMLTNGKTSGNGAGICADSGSFEIFYEGYLSISHCKALNGGAIYSSNMISGSIKASGPLTRYSYLLLEYNEADSFGGAVANNWQFLGDTIVMQYNKAYYGGAVSGCSSTAGWRTIGPSLSFHAAYGLIQYNTAVYGGAFFNSYTVQGILMNIRGNQALKGAAIYGTASVIPKISLSYGGFSIYNPRPDGSRQNEIYADYFTSPGSGGYNVEIRNCWFGDSDTTGLFDYEKTTGKKLLSSSVFRYAVIDWVLNDGKPIGFSPSFPLSAKFRLNTGDSLAYGSLPLLSGNYSSSIGSFSPSTASMEYKNTITSTYTASTAGITDIMAIIDADTFSIKQSVSSIAEAGFEQVKLYPNPATDELYIQGVEQGSVLDLYDMAGRLLKSEQLINNKTVLDVKPLVAGLYLLKITNQEGKVGTARVLKE